MTAARLSHGGVAVYDSDTGRLLRWLMMSSGTPTAVTIKAGTATVSFTDGTQAAFSLESGELEDPLNIS